MKIEFEEKDLTLIDNINKDLDAGEKPILFVNEVDRQYFISFTCKDIAKANAFIRGLIRNQDFNNKELEEKFGIMIDSINYCEGDLKAKKLKSLLQDFITELDKL